MLAQRRAFVAGAKDAAPAKDWNDAINEVLQSTRQGIGHEVEAIGGPGLEPAFDIIGYLFGRTHDDAMTPASGKRPDELTHGIAVLPGLCQRGVKERMVAVALAGQRQVVRKLFVQLETIWRYAQGAG